MTDVNPSPTPPVDPNADSRLGAAADRALAAFADRGVTAEWTRGGLMLTVPREHHRDLAAFLRDDPELLFTRFVDLCGVDALELGRGYRYAVVYHLHSFHLERWIGVRVPLDESDPTLPSLAPHWPAANWYEREAHDLFGIEFAGHPNLERILLPDDWDEGYPLRKDHPFEPEVVEFSFNVDQINAGKVVQRTKIRPTTKR